MKLTAKDLRDLDSPETKRLRAEVRRLKRAMLLACEMCESPVIGWETLGKHLDKALKPAPKKRGGKR